jgi:hypothetical protein
MGSLKNTKISNSSSKSGHTSVHKQSLHQSFTFFCLYKVLCRSYAQTECDWAPLKTKKMGMNLAVINNLCSVLMSAKNLIYFLKILTQNWWTKFAMVLGCTMEFPPILHSPQIRGFAFSNNVFCFGICISGSRGHQSQSLVIGLSENPHLKAPRISTQN